jgi:sortase A
MGIPVNKSMKARSLLLALGLSAAAGLSLLRLAWSDSTWADGPSVRALSAAQQWIAKVEVYEAGIPQILHIPKLGIDAPIELVGQTGSGAMDVPKAWDNVGWYEPGTRPGEKGSAVIAGHLDSNTGKAVFWDLHMLQSGDAIEVHDDRGNVHTFVVERKEAHDDSTAPLHKIFAESGERRLNLITCDGTWSEREQRYSKRLVVYTRMRD